MTGPETGAGAGPMAAGANYTPYNNNSVRFSLRSFTAFLTNETGKPSQHIQHHDGGVVTGQGVNDPYSSAAGTGTGAGYGSANIPPASTLSHGNERHRDGSGKRFSGKVEHAVGSMLGSNALKAKGLQKQQ